MSETENPGKAPHRVAVFEAINDALRETYVGVSRHPISEIAARFPQELPPAARHWRPDHFVVYNVIEPSITLEDARTFIRHFAAVVEAAGWKALREDS